jgi:O-antigen/teichoic acid export membrane protein
VGSRGTSEEPLAAPTAGAAAARGGALRVAAYAAGQGMAVGAAALLFRHLGVADAGRYITVLALVAIVQGLADAGLGTLATRELAVRPAAERRALLGRLLGVRLALSAAGVAVAVGFAAVAGYDSTMVAGTAVAGVGAVLLGVQGTLAASLLVRLEGGRVALAEVARQAAGLALVAIAVAAGAGLLTFFGVYAAAALVATAVTAVGVLAAPRLAGGRALLRGALPFAVAAAASVLFFRVAVLQMSLLADEDETGLFAASFRIVEVLVAVPALALGAGFPVLAARAAAGDRAGLSRAVERALEAMAGLGGAVALVLVLGAPWVVTTVAGEDFAGAGEVLRIQAVALAASFAAAPWGFALLGLRRERALAWANVVGVALALGVAAALIEAEGARGAAIATVLGEAGLMVAFAVLLARAGVALGLRAALPALGAVGAGALVALIPGLGDPARMALGGAVYLVTWRTLARRGRR